MSCLEEEVKAIKRLGKYCQVAEAGDEAYFYVVYGGPGVSRIFTEGTKVYKSKEDALAIAGILSKNVFCSCKYDCVDWEKSRIKLGARVKMYNIKHFPLGR